MTEVRYSPKIRPEHLARKAIVYLLWIPGHDDGDSEMIVMVVPK